MSVNPLTELAVVFSDRISGRVVSLARLEQPDLRELVASRAAGGLNAEIVPIRLACERLLHTIGTARD